MNAEPEDGCAIVQRGCCLGSAGGAVLGVLLLVVAAAVDRSFGELVAFPLAALVGAVVGGVTGTGSGMALGLAEQSCQLDDCRRRVLGAAASAFVAPFCIVWASSGLGSGDAFVVVVVGLVGAVAGAVLAPRAVHGRHKGETP